jgi:hypothetical protein
MVAQLPNGLELKVGPIWLRRLEEPRLLVLHFWQTPLSVRQIAAAAAILRLALRQHVPRHAFHEIDFVSVAVPELSEARRFRNWDWKQLGPLSEVELLKFSNQLASAWAAYRRRGPREIKPRRSRGELF